MHLKERVTLKTNSISLAAKKQIPNFNIKAAKITDLELRTSTCAFGSQKWKQKVGSFLKNINTLTPKTRKKVGRFSKIKEERNSTKKGRPRKAEKQKRKENAAILSFVVDFIYQKTKTKEANSRIENTVRLS